jgi:DNA repair protein RecO (recombination protein O)
MAAEKTQALVLRTTDWSETSRIATVWTRQFGKVRVLAKGGRRLKSNFESALDLLTLCSIVFLRKSSGGLDLLTEAQVTERFPRLRTNLPALYAAYYVAELLSDWTEDYDPHPLLFDEAVATLSCLGQADVPTGPRLVQFELVLLRELGYRPALTACASCGVSQHPTPGGADLVFSPAAGGVLCPRCRERQRDCRPLSAAAWQALNTLGDSDDGRRQPWDKPLSTEVRRLLDQYVTYLLGHPPRMLPYLGS